MRERESSKRNGKAKWARKKGNETTYESVINADDDGDDDDDENDEEADPSLAASRACRLDRFLRLVETVEPRGFRSGVSTSERET